MKEKIGKIKEGVEKFVGAYRKLTKQRRWIVLALGFTAACLLVFLVWYLIVHFRDFTGRQRFILIMLFLYGFSHVREVKDKALELDWRIEEIFHTSSQDEALIYHRLREFPFYSLFSVIADVFRGQGALILFIAITELIIEVDTNLVSESDRAMIVIYALIVYFVLWISIAVCLPKNCFIWIDRAKNAKVEKLMQQKKKKREKEKENKQNAPEVENVLASEQLPSAPKAEGPKVEEDEALSRPSRNLCKPAMCGVE